MEQNKKNNIIKNIITVFLAISILWLSIYFAFLISTTNIKTYMYFYEQDATSDELQATDSELESYAKNIISYIYGFKGDLQERGNIKGTEQDLYTENELLHMQDVKKVITGFSALSAIFLIIFLVCGGLLVFNGDKYKNKFSSLLKILIIEFGMVLVLIGIIALNFDQAFVLFHKILFPQGNWTFPRRCVLVNLITEELLFTFAIQICLYAILIMASFLTICYIIKKDSIKTKTKKIKSVE